MPQQVLQAFLDVMTIQIVLYVSFGVFIGYIVGALPGLNRATAIALLIPFTYKLPPLVAISFLIGINKGGATGSAHHSHPHQRARRAVVRRHHARRLSDDAAGQGAEGLEDCALRLGRSATSSPPSRSSC